ncbi:MAG: TlpA family protein disulfide reductase [Deltaproteobacteria bacterium]|nr:TlpA family protein disulfide reductase [Deltaproteobacteria bacterium]
MRTQLVAVIVLLLLPFQVGAETLGVGTAEGDKAPSFEAATIDGQKIRSSDLRQGKAMLLFFWTTWCPFCITEIPKMKEAHSALGPKGLTFLAVNPGINDSLKKVQLYLDKYAITYPVTFDEGASMAKSFQVMGVPTYIMVDGNGIIRYRGNTIPSDLASRVESMIR